MKSQLVLWNVNPLACIPFWPARSCLGNKFRNPNPQRVRKGPHFPDFSYQKAGQMGSTAISLYNTVYIYIYIYAHTHTPKKDLSWARPENHSLPVFLPPFPSSSTAVHAPSRSSLDPNGNAPSAEGNWNSSSWWPTTWPTPSRHGLTTGKLAHRVDLGHAHRVVSDDIIEHVHFIKTRMCA